LCTIPAVILSVPLHQLFRYDDDDDDDDEEGDDYDEDDCLV
jgi:hypothetical protein